MGDLFNIQKKVLIPEHQFKAILSENEKKKKKPSTPHIRIRQLQDKREKEKIKTKNENDIKWEKIAKRVTPLFNPNVGNALSSVEQSETSKDKTDEEAPIDVANYISENTTSRHLTKSLNLFEICLRFPEIEISQSHVKVNGKILPINTLDLFNNITGSSRKKLSNAAKPLLNIIAGEPDVLSCVSNVGARDYISSLNKTPEQRSSSVRRPRSRRPSVTANLNPLFNEAADDAEADAVDESMNAVSFSSSAKRKKGSGAQKAKSTPKIRWVNY